MCLISISLAQAQAIGDASRAAQEHEKRLQQEQERQRYQKSLRDNDPDIFLQKETVTNTDPIFDEQTQCVDVKSINVTGVTQFTMQYIEEITHDYLNRCLGLADINGLIKRISNLYLNKGLVTSRAFLQPQNLADGVLDILVIEGQLEFLSSTNGSLSERQLYWAFPVVNGDVINLRDLEQGLENINRLQQNRVTMELAPGTSTGQTQVQINNQQGDRWFIASEVNNSGSDATGIWLGTTSLSLDNPVGVNDSLYVSVSDSLDAPSQALSQSTSLSYSIPYGYSMLTYNGSYFRYQQLVQGEVVNFVTSGNSANHTLTFDHMLHRGQLDKWKGTISLARKQTRNYLQDVFLDTSSRTLYIAKLGSNYTRSTKTGSWHGSLFWHRSVDWFDAKKELVSAEDDFQFDKLTLDIRYQTQWQWWDTPVSFSSNAHLFYTPDEIVTSEALSLGGRYSVRGIEGDSLVGYQGGYWRNEITVSQNTAIGYISAIAGIDVGASDTPLFDGNESDWLAGAAIGARLSNRWINLDITYAQALRTPHYLNSDDYGVYASLRLNF